MQAPIVLDICAAVKQLQESPELADAINKALSGPRVMRAKMVVNVANEYGNCDMLSFNAVHKSDGYPADGSDEDNTFARWTPSATLTMTITNPALCGKFKQGQKFYVDFTPAD
jgi:hypothetical protein